MKDFKTNDNAKFGFYYVLNLVMNVLFIFCRRTTRTRTTTSDNNDNNHKINLMAMAFLNETSRNFDFLRCAIPVMCSNY